MIRFFDGFEYLLDDLRVQGGATVERNGHPEGTFAVDAMTPLRPEQLETSNCSARSASIAVHRGSLGIYLDSGGQNLAAEETIALIAW